MQSLPAYIYWVFFLTTAFAVGMLFRSANRSILTLVILLIWLAVQAVISIAGFYTVTDVLPPRLAFALFPPLICICALLVTRSGKAWIDRLDVRILVLLHLVRIPVEFTLFWLSQHKAVPLIMTFEGRNFDILCGLTAPLVWYFGYIRKVWGRGVLIVWNIICLLLLANIVITAILAAPSPFQQLAHDQPNIAVLHFPFVWLPCCIVPAVILAHAVALRQLFKTPDRT